MALNFTSGEILSVLRVPKTSDPHSDPVSHFPFMVGFLYTKIFLSSYQHKTIMKSKWMFHSMILNTQRVTTWSLHFLVLNAHGIAWNGCNAPSRVVFVDTTDLDNA